MAPIVVIDSEQAPLSDILLRLDLAGCGGIRETGFHPAPAIDLSYAARRKRADQCVIDRRLVVDKVESVEAAHDVSEHEGADQPLVDAVTLDDADGRILGGDFAAVLKLETPDAHVGGLAAEEVFGPNECLLREEHGGVAIPVIGHVIAG